MPFRLRLPRTHWADRSLLVFLLATTAWLSLTLARGPGELAAIWVGNGILTGWLLSRPTATWPGYMAVALAAELPARMLAGDPLGYAFLIALCNLAEAVLVAGLVRRRIPDVRDPRDWLALGGIATVSTVAACAVSGALAAAVAHYLNGQPYLVAWGGWFAAHVIGMVILATATLVVQREGMGLFAARGRRPALLLDMGLVLVVGTAVFFLPYPLLFLTYPPLLLVAVRHRLAGVALGVMALGLIGALTTSQGYGPLAALGLDGDGRIALLQIYLAGGCLMTIPMCLLTAERRRLVVRLGESERRYRMLAEYSHDVIVRMRADGERLYVSPSITEVLGWQPGELPGTHWDTLHPDDHSPQREAVDGVLATGGSRTDRYRVRRKGGGYVWFEAVSRSIPADDGGELPDIIIAARDISRRVAAEQALAESRQELERLSREDALTDLANRRQFDERLGVALRRLRRHGVPVALLSLDIDHFKTINDTHGHAAGDAVLQAFAARLRGCVRDTDLVARPGGDEFSILIEDATPGAAEAVAGKVLAAVREPVVIGETRIPVSTSIGIAKAVAPVEASVLMEQADAALYAAKKAGRGRYHVAPTAP